MSSSLNTPKGFSEVQSEFTLYHIHCIIDLISDKHLI